MFIISFTFLSGYRDDQTLVKRDCNWNIFTIDGENWKKEQLVQIHHTSTGGIYDTYDIVNSVASVMNYISTYNRKLNAIG